MQSEAAIAPARNDASVEHVAVTGMGIVSPIGATVQCFWQGLTQGRRAITPIADAPVKLTGNALWAAVAEGFLLDASLDSTALRNTDRFTQYAVAATAQALAHAQLAPPDDTAVIVGNTMGGLPFVAQSQSRFIESGGKSVSPKLMALIIPNMAPARVAMHWKLHGQQLAISTACASSLDAIGTAANMIERGEIDTAIAGGTETLLSPLVYESLVRAGALSRNVDPQRASRPFDADRDGFVMGDGSAMLVLESVERATRRGAPILARIRGYGSIADAHHITSPDPSARYEIAAMEKALAQAGDAAHECSVVYAHATGTIVGDAAEMRAINAVNPNALVTSIKGHIGHSMAGAAAMCAVAGIAGMHEHCVPPTMGTQCLESEARFELVMERPRTFGYDAFQVNAFGFGGQNASIVLSR